MSSDDRVLRDQLVEFLRGSSAHIDVRAALKDFPVKLYGAKPKGAPHTAWQLLEHIRFTLHDLLDFCLNPKYVTPEWPKEYWPKEEAPPSSDAWKACAKAIHEDLAAFERLAGDPGSNLYARIPWGDGQTLLREILLAGDHTSYHLGQLVMLRKQLEE
jgi:hypothetical protein